MNLVIVLVAVLFVLVLGVLWALHLHITAAFFLAVGVFLADLIPDSLRKEVWDFIRGR
jgi:hypothetical protein